MVILGEVCHCNRWFVWNVEVLNVQSTPFPAYTIVLSHHLLDPVDQQHNTM